MRKHGLYFIIGGLFFISLFSIFCYHLRVMADDLEKNAYEVIDKDNGYLSSYSEDTEDTDTVLSDTTGYIYSDQEITAEEPEETTENEELTPDEEFKYILIFSLGIISGILIGKVILGFVS